MAKKDTQVVTTASEEQLAILNSSFPKDEGFKRQQLPRLGMVSQDKTEGKGKSMVVVEEAGTFFIEEESDEVDENGKKVWNKKEIGTEIDAIILFQRNQLKFYEEKTGTFTSSSVYDTDDEIIPLWQNKAEIAKDTPANLKARPEYQFEKDGKIKSKLEDNRILYILYNGVMYQMNLRGSSMYSWMVYRRSCNPSTVLTHLSSEAKEKGSIAWNQMKFDKVRSISSEEAETVIEKVKEIKYAITAEKEFFATQKVEGQNNLDKF